MSRQFSSDPELSPAIQCENPQYVPNNPPRQEVYFQCTTENPSNQRENILYDDVIPWAPEGHFASSGMPIPKPLGNNPYYSNRQSITPLGDSWDQETDSLKTSISSQQSILQYSVEPSQEQGSSFSTVTKNILQPRGYSVGFRGNPGYQEHLNAPCRVVVFSGLSSSDPSSPRLVCCAENHNDGGLPDFPPSSNPLHGNKSILKAVTSNMSNMLSTQLVFSLAGGAGTKLQARRQL